MWTQDLHGLIFLELEQHSLPSACNNWNLDEAWFLWTPWSTSWSSHAFICCGYGWFPGALATWGAKRTDGANLQTGELSYIAIAAIHGVLWHCLGSFFVTKFQIQLMTTLVLLSHPQTPCNVLRRKGKSQAPGTSWSKQESQKSRNRVHKLLNYPIWKNNKLSVLCPTLFCCLPKASAKCWKVIRCQSWSLGYKFARSASKPSRSGGHTFNPQRLFSEKGGGVNMSTIDKHWPIQPYSTI